MSDKCANPKCGKELIHIEGRKKKKYCGAACKTVHWQELHPKRGKAKTKRVPIEEWEEIKKQLKSVPIVENKNSFTFTKPTASSYDGKETTRFILDEVGLTNPFDNSSIESKIKAYEEELKHVGTGSVGKLRRKFIENQLFKLKK